MPNYRRGWLRGGTYFFTVNLLRRNGNDLLVTRVDLLREAVRDVRRRYPFVIHGCVVLPDHMHCVIELPPGDADFAMRWRLIKMNFSRCLPKTETVSQSRLMRGERGIWQRRYWEHSIRDESDFAAHMDYIQSTRSNTVLSRGWPIGHIQHFMAWSSAACIPWTGLAGMRSC